MSIAQPDPGAEAAAWWKQAACIGRTDLFFAPDRFSQRVAVTICRGCPVRRECLVDITAAEAGTYRRYGVVAGLTAKRREQSGA